MKKSIFTYVLDALFLAQFIFACTIGITDTIIEGLNSVSVSRITILILATVAMAQHFQLKDAQSTIDMYRKLVPSSKKRLYDGE